MNGQQSLLLRAIELAGDGNYFGRGSDRPASGRNGGSYPTNSGVSLGFRPALYVKL